MVKSRVSHWDKISMLTELFLAEGSGRESVSLSLAASRSCLHSLALDYIPSSKTKLTGRVFLTSSSDPYFSASLLYI